MYNQNGPNPEGYDYLKDIKTFGNLVCECVEEYKEHVEAYRNDVKRLDEIS
jgi:uncharacterized Fe-S cluster-containing MiaB family protein